MNGVREALFNLRYRVFGVRVGGPHASMRGQWLALAVAILVVFGCFYAVGRFLHSGGGSGPGAPSSLAGAGPSAIPASLSGGSPVAGAVPVAIAVKPRPQLKVQAPVETNLPGVAPVKTFSSEASAGSHSSGEQQPPRRAGEEVSSEAPPVKTSKPSRRKGESASARRRARASQPSGPVTFDTSE
jgi:hypothetical protein